jgi:hypothetical protein
MNEYIVLKPESSDNRKKKGYRRGGGGDKGILRLFLCILL